MKTSGIALLSAFLLISAMNSWAATPQITNITVNNEVLEIQGKQLGYHCGQCEVIAKFKGLNYSLTIDNWRNNTITAKLPDIGKNLDPAIELHLANWSSKPKKVRLKPSYLPKKRSRDFVKGYNSTDLLVFSRRYDSSFGGKGDEQFAVEQALPQCGKTAAIFDSARIVMGKRTRFGEAAITRLPKAGCQKCNISVVYFYEPTGRLEYQLQVYRRVVRGVCSNQVR